MTKLFLLCCLLTTLTACSWFNSNPHLSREDNAKCQEIKKRIIFSSGGVSNSFNLNGAANNTMATAQQSAERDTLEKSYRDAGCT